MNYHLNHRLILPQKIRPKEEYMKGISEATSCNTVKSLSESVQVTSTKQKIIVLVIDVLTFKLGSQIH